MAVSRSLVSLALGALGVMACSGAAPSESASPLTVDGSDAAEAPVPDGSSAPADAAPGADAAPPAVDDAGIDSATPDDAAPACKPLDVPSCDKGPSSDSACSIYAPPSTPYGCRNKIAADCAALPSGTGWCCPTPGSGPSCSANDPFCAAQGAAACGLTSGCLSPRPGCRSFANGAQTIWCCTP